jgi:hypothetical protein
VARQSQATNTTFLYAQDPAGSLQQACPWQQSPVWELAELAGSLLPDQPFDTERSVILIRGYEDYINNLSVRSATC